MRHYAARTLTRRAVFYDSEDGESGDDNGDDNDLISILTSLMWRDPTQVFLLHVYHYIGFL